MRGGRPVPAFPYGKKPIAKALFNVILRPVAARLFRCRLLEPSTSGDAAAYNAN
jgi:hypothetical protein